MSGEDNVKRIARWDNLRFILIVFVVVGHFINLYTAEYESFKSFFLIIYSFHMQLFVFISGYFHKDRDIPRKSFTYFSIYFLYVAAVSILIWWQDPSKDTISIFSEVGVPWFMFALGVFIPLTYALRDVNKIYLLVFSVFLALLAGYDRTIGDFLVLSRIISFYPWYILGNIMSGNRKLDEVTSRKSCRLIALGIILVWIVLCILNPEGLWKMRLMFKGRTPYNDSMRSFGCLYKLGGYAISLLMGFSVLCLVPGKEIKGITELGRRTLQSYFWHRPILYIFTIIGLSDCLVATLPGRITYVALAVALTFVISLRPFSFPTQTIRNAIYGKPLFPRSK